MGPKAASGAVAASMLGHPEAGLQGKIFTVDGEGGAEHLLSSLAPQGHVTGLSCSHPATPMRDEAGARGRGGADHSPE